jgi:hypothetical protein
VARPTSAPISKLTEGKSVRVMIRTESMSVKMIKMLPQLNGFLRLERVCDSQREYICQSNDQYGRYICKSNKDAPPVNRFPLARACVTRTEANL